MLRAQQLLQCIIQARWHDESPLMTLPHVEDFHLASFKKIRVREPVLTLAGLKDVSLHKYEQLAGPLRDAFEESQIENIFKVNFPSTTTTNSTDSNNVNLAGTL